ncbi:rho guanine nucleotide exchange factor 12 isoform X5 [Diachasma alloeum]|uniref:rho guanine nucleotide exchange factor 12 isoform X5 n=1 Tax=Diachasma alloeum TaxID=454923 RepID=UPI000738292B|nr:rho guanine nucleotide exchange factor 12 isoform X5 [Diachasma alloeum]
MNGTTTPLRRAVGAGKVGQEPLPVATLVVYKDDAGYGMKVSGDNPVYVQSVKEGGAAARAGLVAGDRILKVNGVNVMQSVHTDVVELIKSSTQVVLTVQPDPVLATLANHPVRSTGIHEGQQRPTSLTPSGSMVSPSQSATSLHRAATAPAGGAPCSTRITGPQPVDHEKKRQMDAQRVNTFQLMLEKEQSYVDKLRSDLAKAGVSSGNTSSIVNLQSELAGAERRVRKLQEELAAMTPSDQFSQEAHLSSPTALSKHQRTKSSPEQLGTSISSSEASRRLIASESMSDLSPYRHTRHSGIDLDDPIHITPPGTPPPPYPQPPQNADLLSSTLNDSIINESFPTASPPRQASTETPGLPTIQQPIMSMEDDDMSDQEVGQLEDHGPFKSLSRLWEHHAHLSVFINYVLSNSDPSGLLFYLVTDLYKEGNAKEMKKWAYEIHSSFLVPGAPLRLNNVDENIAREIDDVLLKESDKEEILRKIFWKARAKAKEELNEQLADFQQKRTAGLGMLFGPSDIQLDESESDKSKEAKIIETFLLPKMEGYLEDIEKDQGDLRQFTTAAGLATILTKIFQVRCVSLDRVPTFVAKDKSNIKARLLTAKNRKMTVRGHHFAAHQYFTVTYCNHCQLIIGGIGPQGYQCTDCSLSVHRPCVRVVEENCPGPVVRKERANDALSKLMERIYRPERKPPSSHHYHQNQLHLVERAKRAEEEGALIDGENGEHRGVASGNTRSSAERGRLFGFNDHPDNMDDPFPREDISEMVQQNISSKPKTSNINRSESYKERIHNKRQLREKRKTSDPNLSKTNRTGFSDCEASGAFPGNSAGSSSNSSLSTRSLDSPSTSLEQVHSTAPGNNNTSSWDSDVDVEPDPPDWSQGVSEEVLARLSNSEKKRQEVINELFHTERSHVRALKVLSYVFHKPLLEHQVLPVDQIDLLFSNLDEMVTIHSRFNQAMKRKKKENPCVGDVGDLILDMFDGENGEAFEQAASTYCAKQQVALDNLRDRRRKDQKLNSFLSEIESNPMCRRLQLKDHIVTGMLRLTKYPLLFENLAKYTPESSERERAAVLRGLERSKEILSLVNQAVREAEDCQRLTEILRMIDRSAFDKFDHPTVQEFKNLDITKRTLIHEGPLQWRIVNRPKPVDLHVVLLDDTILLLHRQDEKYLLKFMNTNQVNSVLSPIVKVSTVLVRNNAVDKNSLYLVNTSQKGAQIYDLVAASSAECKLWCKHISEAADAYNKARSREGRRPSSPQASMNNSSEETPEGNPDKQDNENDNHLDKDKGGDKGNESEQYLLGDNRDSSSSVNNLGDGGKESGGSEDSGKAAGASTPGDASGGQDNAGNNSSESTNAGIGETMRLVTCTQCSLIDPTEVHAEVRPIHVAEPVLTPIERLRRKDQVIREALVEKQSLVADILNIPKEDFEHVADMADMASEHTALEKEPAEVILVAINQANQLISLINMALVVTESEAVLAAKGSSGAALGCGAAGCPVPRSGGDGLQPSVPVAALQPVCHSLNLQLSQLLEIVKEREGERERLRKELRRSRERLHAFDVDAQKREPPQSDTNTSQTSTESPPCSSSAEGGPEDSIKDEFVDACEESLQTKSDETKDTVKTQVMGDCVG